MLDPKVLRARILEVLPDADVEVRDTTGTGDHFEARVVSAAFEGKSRIEQHQAVYGALQAWLSTGELHALQLKTWTPADWARSQQ